ncbi:MAG TPA: DUF4129 domain-containing protein, partial [Ktedonobacteraceae bacterium]|nr:DUF4129 domain-containing protein [Ktedonobacteraceae bacterium]
MSSPADDAKQQTELQKQKERRRQHLLDMETTEIAEAPSVGERLLPLLYAAMETCWVDAIFLGLAALGLFSTHNPLMPLWAPFVFIAGSQWLYLVLERREGRKTPAEQEGEDNTARSMIPDAPLFVTLIALVTLVVIWASVYAQSWLPFDPRWLLAMLNDILLLNVQAYHIIIVLALSLYFCWRGIRLSQREIQPTSVFSILRTGMIIIIAVVLLRAAVASANPGVGLGGGNELTLLLLVPLFLFFALAAHALAQITFVRHTHPTGLEGSTAAQEQSILSITAIIGAILLVISFIVNSFASPAFLAQTQQTFAWVGAVYDFLVNVVSRVLVFLLTPVFWLLTLWFQQHAPQLPRITRPGDAIKNKIHAPPPQTYPGVILFAKILVPILIIALLVLLLWLALRRRHVRIVRRGRPNEIRESLWSWLLFWTQVKALFLSLFRRFFPRKQQQEEQAEAFSELEGEPAARSIREVYRLLLRRAASRGYPRHRDETPYEFRQRLDERLPQTEPQLESITEAYAATRYGGLVPDESTVA